MLTTLLLPGIGTVDHLKMAKDLGVNTIRVATHCTEADVSEQHIGLARKLGVDTVGFLMMSHMNDAAGLVSQAKLMEGYGANCIYITDSAGYMLPDDVRARIGALRAAQDAVRIPAVGVHGLERSQPVRVLPRVGLQVAPLHLGDCRGRRLDVHQRVVGLAVLLDLEGDGLEAPVLGLADLAAKGLDGAEGCSVDADDLAVGGEAALP